MKLRAFQVSITAWSFLVLTEFVGTIARFRGLGVLARRSPVMRFPRRDLSILASGINTAFAFYTHERLCLPRAIVSCCTLRAHGISASVVIGVKQMPFKAHAWVEIDDVPFNERHRTREYAVIERFDFEGSKKAECRY